jgi:hypothetical protein
LPAHAARERPWIGDQGAHDVDPVARLQRGVPLDAYPEAREAKRGGVEAVADNELREAHGVGNASAWREFHGNDVLHLRRRPGDRDDQGALA